MYDMLMKLVVSTFPDAHDPLPEGYSAHAAHPEMYPESPFNATVLFSAKV